MSDLASLPPDVFTDDVKLGLIDRDAAPQDDLPSLPSDCDTSAGEESLPPPVKTDSEELGESVIMCSCKWNCAQNVKKADILCIMEDMIPKLFSREQSLYNEVS